MKYKGITNKWTAYSWCFGGSKTMAICRWKFIGKNNTACFIV